MIGYDYFDAVLRFVMATLLTILGLWVKEGVLEVERETLLEKDKKQKMFGTQAILEVSIY
jgi:hypothetical protein